MKTTAYYNELDPHAAQWLRNLIEAGHIPAGDVDDRDIKEVTPDDLAGYTQCHFFAGIGGWPYALELAGWPEDRSVWTGSCPCQPLSGAGQRKGHADRRHLWPAFQSLIAESKPPVVFGEQVASKDGREWLSAVRADLEELGYACGCADLAAASVGAPHIRQRLFWVADSESGEAHTATAERLHAELANGGGMGDSEHNGSSSIKQPGGEKDKRGLLEPERSSGGMDDPPRIGRQHKSHIGCGDGERSQQTEQGSESGDRCIHGWQAAELIECADGKARPTQPGLRPLANGVSSRMVYNCAICETETVTYENVRILRKVPGGNKRLQQAKVLLSFLHGAINDENSEHSNGWAMAGSSPVSEQRMRILRNIQESAASSPCQPRPDGQPAEQHPNTLPEMSCTASSQSATAIEMRGMRRLVCGEGPSEKSKDMFCPVCERVGPHQCTQEVGPSRIGRLRAYGNAICPQAAAQFIAAYTEAVK